MPESVAAVGAYFGAASEGAAVAEGVAGAATIETAGSAAALASAGASAGAAGGAGAGITAGGAVAAGAGGGTLLGNLGKTAATTAVSAGVNAALTPKKPDLPGVLPMPDPVAQEEARKRSIIEQTARRGRSSTILTDAGAGTLGG